jgi:hypothetical protein
MKLQFKEAPKEWRKITLLGLIGPSVLLGLLRWRGVVSWKFLAAALVVFALVGVCACLRPRWFRSYYRFATRVGFHTVQLFGRVVLTAVFFLILVPIGWGLRLLGKDLLQLKSSRNSPSFWRPARQDGSLDGMS